MHLFFGGGAGEPFSAGDGYGARGAGECVFGGAAVDACAVQTAYGEIAGGRCVWELVAVGELAEGFAGDGERGGDECGAGNGVCGRDICGADAVLFAAQFDCDLHCAAAAFECDRGRGGEPDFDSAAGAGVDHAELRRRESFAAWEMGGGEFSTGEFSSGAGDGDRGTVCGAGGVVLFAHRTRHSVKRKESHEPERRRTSSARDA